MQEENKHKKLRKKTSVCVTHDDSIFVLTYNANTILIMLCASMGVIKKQGASLCAGASDRMRVSGPYFYVTSRTTSHLHMRAIIEIQRDAMEKGNEKKVVQ